MWFLTPRGAWQFYKLPRQFGGSFKKKVSQNPGNKLKRFCL